jgi:hypothetical protein
MKRRIWALVLVAVAAASLSAFVSGVGRAALGSGEKHE